MVIWIMWLLIVMRDGSSMSITVAGAMLKVVPLMVTLCCGGGALGACCGGGGAFGACCGGGGSTAFVNPNNGRGPVWLYGC